MRFTYLIKTSWNPLISPLFVGVILIFQANTKTYPPFMLVFSSVLLLWSSLRFFRHTAPDERGVGIRDKRALLSWFFFGVVLILGMLYLIFQLYNAVLFGGGYRNTLLYWGQFLSNGFSVVALAIGFLVTSFRILEVYWKLSALPPDHLLLRSSLTHKGCVKSPNDI